jgi:hypothetical protein
MPGRDTAGRSVHCDHVASVAVSAPWRFGIPGCRINACAILFRLGRYRARAALGCCELLGLRLALGLVAQKL